MFSFSFKNRIAFNYIVSTALLISIVFLLIFQIVKYSVYNHINADIAVEVEKHLKEISLDSQETYLLQVDQWRAREHNTVDVNPVFVQFYDSNNQLIDKSPNLKNLNLNLFSIEKDNQYIDTQLNKKPIRQIQVPVFQEKEIIGHLVIAMSLDDAEMVIGNLSNILLISIPLILIVLFLIARFFAGRSIQPVRTIIETSSQITKDNLQTRIPLPQNKDELYVLSENINNLLNRIENAVDREKQFTSDASHELRTPLAVMKGTMEVLIRKPRNQQEYEEKIQFCISEVDRLNHMVDQLLLLARFENQKQNVKQESIYLNALILDNLTRFSDKIESKKLKIKADFTDDYYIQSDNYLVSIIFSNLISNAIKYSHDNGEIVLQLEKTSTEIIFTVSDNGVGISEQDLNKIFNSFYRSDVSNHPEIKGTGLGLSIVKRLCDLLNFKITVESKQNERTQFRLFFQFYNLSSS
ncbi:MAG: HAMP domain-containing histidine kinase [Flavobacterium sp.]|nr:MAG: HAMP domain-containing histidine kinase [Flavobacterium sp.]